MPAERKPGSNLGRAATDWEAAFLTYAAHPPDQRSYQVVADIHEVSVRTVERHGRNRNWKTRAAAIDREAQNVAAALLTEQRAAKISDVEKLVDATFVYYAGLIRDGKVKMSAADLRRLHELRGELWADQPIEPAEPLSATHPSATIDSSERKLEVLRALRDAGVLETIDEHDDPDDDDVGRDDHEQEVA
jgi:hypothetical protein